MSNDVGSVTTSSGVVENVGVAVGISLISHSVPEKHSTSGLVSVILNFVSRRRTCEYRRLAYCLQTKFVGKMYEYI